MADKTEKLSRSNGPRLAQCISCGSFDVKRTKGGNGQGPTDSCQHCNSQWPHKPGTMPASMYAPQITMMSRSEESPRLQSRAALALTR